jgi:hypothetical protein
MSVNTASCPPVELSRLPLRRPGGSLTHTAALRADQHSRRRGRFRRETPTRCAQLETAPLDELRQHWSHKQRGAAAHARFSRVAIPASTFLGVRLERACICTATRAKALLLATDESQGGWAEHFGGCYRSGGRCRGAEIASCELGSARRADLGPVFARICAGVIVAGVVDVESSG